MTHAAMVPRAHLSLEKVSVRFGDRKALENITVDLPAGAITAILGPNGAGKSTLLRILAGTLRPSNGRVALPAFDAGNGITSIAQKSALYSHLTVRENCMVSGRMEGARGSKLQARADAAIKDTLCEGYEHHLVSRLSGGYQRRAAIAAALMGQASLVILDEPTTGLDIEAVDAIATILQNLASAGRTIVLTTHDFALADALADKVLFLRAGTLRATGGPTELCRQQFAAQKHVECTLVQAPDAVQRTALASLGAMRHADRRYSLFSDVDTSGFPERLISVQAAGIALREVRIRDAGTAALFEHFCLTRGSP